MLVGESDAKGGLEVKCASLSDLRSRMAPDTGVTGRALYIGKDPDGHSLAGQDTFEQFGFRISGGFHRADSYILREGEAGATTFECPPTAIACGLVVKPDPLAGSPAIRYGIAVFLRSDTTKPAYNAIVTWPDLCIVCNRPNSLYQIRIWAEMGKPRIRSAEVFFRSNSSQ
jgi:hypothetical protein